MFNPLSLYQNDKIELSSNKYICKNVQNFTDAQNSLACRYELEDLSEKKRVWLEVKKDRALNYQLFYYEKVQKIEQDPSFLSLVGTQTLGYSNPNKESYFQTIYNRIPKKGEIVMPIKHLVSEDELPNNPKDEGYYQDGNGNWYFMTKRSEGTVKRFDNSKKIRSWEYKHKSERLLIEVDKESDITIYEGKEIARRELKRLFS